MMRYRLEKKKLSCICFFFQKSPSHFLDLVFGFCIGESCWFDRRFGILMKNGPAGFFETCFSMEKNGF